MAYAGYEPEEARTHKPAVVFVDEENKISRVTNYEKHGLLKDMAWKRWYQIRGYHKMKVNSEKRLSQNYDTGPLTEKEEITMQVTKQ